MGGSGFEGQRSLAFRGFSAISGYKSFWDKFVGGFLKKPRRGFHIKSYLWHQQFQASGGFPSPFFSTLDFGYLRLCLASF